MNINVLVDGVPAVLTTEHSASSYGQPVIVINGDGMGVGDCIINRYRRIVPVAGYTPEAVEAFRKFAASPMYGYCFRCGRLWMSRSPIPPTVCPTCGNARWQTPRKGGETGPKQKRNV